MSLKLFFAIMARYDMLGKAKFASKVQNIIFCETYSWQMVKTLTNKNLFIPKSLFNKPTGVYIIPH